VLQHRNRIRVSKLEEYAYDSNSTNGVRLIETGLQDGNGGTPSGQKSTLGLFHSGPRLTDEDFDLSVGDLLFVVAGGWGAPRKTQGERGNGLDGSQYDRMLTVL
jgi:hypothetical protein